MTNKAQILLTTTENYLPHVKTFIKNIIALNRYPINFFILYGFDKSEDEVNKYYQEINEFSNYNVSCKRVRLKLMCELEQQPLKEVNSQNLRLYLHLLNLKGRILYLDIDILVCQNFSEIFNTNLNGKTIGAVVDYNLMYRNMRTNGKYFQRKLQEPLANKELTFTGEKYINSGVLLIDLDQLNKQQKWVQNLPHLHKFKSFADQSFLNYVHYGDIKYLPVIYNYLAYHLINSRAIAFNRKLLPPTYNTYEPNLNLITPVFLHFAGRQKPWNNTAKEFQNAYNMFEQPLKHILDENEEYYVEYFNKLFKKYSYTELLVDPTSDSLINNPRLLTQYRNSKDCHPALCNYKLFGKISLKDYWDEIFLTKLRDDFNEKFYKEINK